MAQRLPQPKFERNKATALSLAKEQLLIIFDNTDYLSEVDKKGKHLRAAQGFMEMIERGEELLPTQLSYIDGILEMCYKGAGWETPGLHIDKKRKQLRFE